MSATVSWRQLWDGTAPLHGRAHARWLCEEASGAYGDEFLQVQDQLVTERSMAHLDAMLARLGAGEPLQYVLGHWSFRHLDLLVDRRVLIPRPETELVADVAIGLARDMPKPIRCADLGTGSGAIGLSLLLELPRSSAEVWLTDSSTEALDVARANAAGLGIAAAGARFSSGSWFEALPETERGQFGLIVANPPYIAYGDPALESAVSDWEPVEALYSGGDGLDALRTIVAGAPAWLASGGWLVLEIGTGQGPAVRSLLDVAGGVDIQIRLDLAGHDRIAIARFVEREG